MREIDLENAQQDSVLTEKCIRLEQELAAAKKELHRTKVYLQNMTNAKDHWLKQYSDLKQAIKDGE